jgi:L-lactate dehydrogenase complex protein LldG
MVAKEPRMNGRARVLEAVRVALDDVAPSERPEDVQVPRNYRVSRPGDPMELFAERVSEYRGEVHRIDAISIPATVKDICRTARVNRLVVPSRIDQAWLPDGNLEVVPDGGLSATDLDGFDGVLTGCCMAIGETGTIVLDGGRVSGRRAITLVPDVHICVVRKDQIVGSVPEAIEALQGGVANARTPLTFVSGPSATSDIEFRRVEGVHGPRRLEVLLID